MAEAIDFSQGIGRRDLEAVRRRFRAVNQERLHRILNELRAPQRDFLHLLPLLFHINHPMLPGFVGSDTPAGIPDFQPDRTQLQAAGKYSRSFRYQHRALRELPIQALYLMGSVGTIGQSRGSDLDIWLCHGADLSPSQVAALAAKAQRLEQWAADLGLETHFFLTDVEAFRRGKKARLSGESSGSTQHGLLLEEFYRTGLLLAGRYPLWWLVPPEQEERYAEYTGELIRKRFVDPNECLDFGGLAEIPVEEYFGAALWQLFKGVHSPYKSLLKILLMEAYARDYPHPDWLAAQIKRAVYAGESDTTRFDAYLLMYRKVEALLQERGQLKRLELARRCLYFKVAEPLSRGQGNGNWRATHMLALTRSWGWSQTELQDLDGRQRWKIERVTRERDELVRELTRSYHLLTDFAASHSDLIEVDPRELDLLGRKLYTALEQRPGKVEAVNPGISADLSEPELTLCWRADADGTGTWSLHRGRFDDTGDRQPAPIKVTEGLAELLAWCQINGICTPATRLHRQPPDGPLGGNELRALLQVLRESLPDSGGLETPLEQLAKSPYPVGAVALVNVGTSAQTVPGREGMHLVSDRADPLSYGSARRCLLHGLDLLIHTSWGELVVHDHRDSEGLLDALCFYLDLVRRGPRQAGEAPLRVEGFASAEAGRLARRVAEVFEGARRFFHAEPHGRYVIELGSGLYLLETTDRGFRWLRHDSLEELLEGLAQPHGRYRPPGCDLRSLSGSPLPTLFANCHRGEQQLFYHSSGGRTWIYVLDESGSLFHQVLDEGDPRFLLMQQQRFLDSLARMRRLSGMAEEAASLVTGPRFFRLERDTDGGWRSLPVQMRRREGDEEFVELRLVAESVGQDTRLLSLVCGDLELSFLTLAEELYPKAVRHILGFRHGSGDYPIYLTAVELIQARYGVPPSGVELLLLKRRVEQRLNETLGSFRTSPAA